MSSKKKLLLSVFLMLTCLLWLSNAVLADDVIDLSHSSTSGGLGVGHKDEAIRWQTFMATQNGELSKIAVFLNYQDNDSNGKPDLTNLVVTLYETANNIPTGEPLKTIEVPVSEVRFGNEMEISINYGGIESGKQYAVGLSQKTLSPDGLTGDHYKWPTANVGYGEHFGKYTESGGFVEETQWVGTGWLKIYLADNVVDLSYDNPSTRGFAFAAQDTAYRWQTFTASKSGKLDGIAVNLNKLGDVSDLVVELYQTASNLPTGDPLIQVIVPASEVNDNTETDIAINYAGIEVGKRYAIALTQTTLAPDGLDKVYEWPTKDIGASEYFGKSSGGNWVDESFLGTGWMKVYITGESVINLSHDQTGGGFGVGVADGEVKRWQTFTVSEFSKLTKIGVLVNHGDKDGNGQVDVSELKAELYATENNLPTGQPLKTVTMPVANVNFGSETLIDFSYEGLITGHRYAVALTQVDLAPNGAEYDHYQWPTKDIGLGEHFGKYSPSGDWVDESFLGTGWLKVYTIPGIAPSAPTTLTLDYNTTPLRVGENFSITPTVFDQYGNEMSDVSVSWTSDDVNVATVNQGVVTAEGIGTTTIAATCAGITEIVDVEVYEPMAKELQAPLFASLAVGDIQDLDISVRDQNDRAMDVSIASSIEDSSIAKVDELSVTGVSVGETKITISAANMSKEIPVTVYPVDEQLVEPTPGMVITEDTTFKPGTYDFRGKEGIEIDADNITVNGNGAVLIGGYDRYNTPTSGSYEFFAGKPDMPNEANKTIKTEVDLTGKTSATLEYDIWYQIEFNWDAAMVQVSDDGVNWTSLATDNTVTADDFAGYYEGIPDNLPGYTGDSNGWIHETIDLSAYAGKKIYLQFRYMTDWATQEHGLYVDSIKITADGAEAFADDAENGLENWQVDGWMVSDGKLSKRGYFGTAVKSVGHTGVTLKNMKAEGFNLGLFVKDGTDWVIENNDFSNNFTDPEYGWGDPYDFGAVLLESTNHSVVRSNIGTNVWTGLYLKYSNDNNVYDNNFSHTSNVSLKMWNASRNIISDNNFSWGIRIDPGETHARDSTSMLMEAGSNDNELYRNDFTHGGDGIFIRVLNGWCSTGNYFEENDTSYANNNAIESWSPGNTYVRNIANYSSYGFWLGGSDNTVLIGNEVKYNGGYNGETRQNAPEAFGNAGVAVVNGASSHFTMIGNDIEYNNGPGVAIRYNSDYPAYHWIIQQNTIKHNANDPRGYKGYGIYIKNAQWLDIAGNNISDNGADPIKIDTNVSDVFIREATMDDKAPVANAVMSTQTVKAGQPVTFDASGSTDPEGLPLNFRWDLGDGTISSKAVVKHTYDKPGFYRVGVTVNNGKLADLDFFNVFVVGPDQEIGTDATAADWNLVSDGSDPVLIQDSNHSVQGETSISVMTTKGTVHKLVYPATKDLGMDVSNKTDMSFFVKYEADNNDSSLRPVVRLYTSENDYFEYVPDKAYLNQASTAKSEGRYTWKKLQFSLENSSWTKNVTGSPSLSDVNYIEIIEGPAYGGHSHFWIDGLQFNNFESDIDFSVDIAKNVEKTGFPKPIYSYSSNEASLMDAWAPLNGNITFYGDYTARWSSLRTDQSVDTDWYGVDFGVQREINRLDLYFYHNPSGTEANDDEWKPDNYSVEYWNGSVWITVPNMIKSSDEVAANLNRVKFNRVTTSKVRVVVNHHNGNVVPTYTSIYGFQAYNTANIAANRYGQALDARSVASSTSVNFTLNQVGVLVNYRKRTDPNNPELQDLIVQLFDTDGHMPVGAPLTVTTVPKTNVNFGAETQIDLNYSGLEPGHRYAISLTQQPLAPDGGTGEHYRWPTSGGVVQGEYFGKYVNGWADESFLGTGWLKVYTDKVTIDYSHSNHNAGWGVGHSGEQRRWQTFSTPADTAWDAIDGSIRPDNGWTTTYSTATSDWLEVTFEKAETFNKVNFFLARDGDTIKLPNNYAIQYWDGADWQDVTVLRGPETPVEGFNTIIFDSVTAKKMKLVVVNPDTASVEVKELEVSAVNTETAAQLQSINMTIDKSLLTPEESALINLTGVMSNGTPAPLDQANIVYSSSDETVATVNETGVVTVQGLGMATITAEVTMGDITLTSGVDITVKPATIPPVTNVKVTSDFDQALLSWSNPATDWENTVLVRRSTTDFPQTPADGDLVYTGSGETYIDKDLAAGTYYYSIFNSWNEFYSTSSTGSVDIDNLHNKTAIRITSFDENGQNLYPVQNWRGDSYTSSKLVLGKGESGKVSDLYLYYPDVVNKLPAGTDVVSAKLVLKIKDGTFINADKPHTIKVYGITDPDNLGTPYYEKTNDTRTGLSFLYRDNRPGLNIPWKEGADNILALFNNVGSVDSLSAVPTVFEMNAIDTVAIDVTSSVKSWVKGNKPNQGFFITIDGDWSAGETISFSGVDASDSLQRPYLQVVYADAGTDVTPPAKVSDLVVDTTSTDIAINWKAPTDSDFAGVRIVRKKGIVPFDPYDGQLVYEGTGTNTLDTGLTAGDIYYYSIFTYDDLRNYSQKVWVEAVPGTPAEPQNISATVQPGLIDLTWDAVTSADRYYLYRKAEDNTSTIKLGPITGTTYSDKNVDEATYKYTIVAANSNGKGQPSASIKVQAQKADTTPVVPTGLHYTVVSGSEVKLTWDTQDNVTEFVIIKKEANADWKYLTQVPFNQNSIVDNNLMPNTTYGYRVKAINSVGASDFTTAVEVTTPDVPVVVNNLNWQVISAGHVKLTWNDPADNNSAYRVEIYTAGEKQWEIPLNANSESCDITGLEVVTTYRFKVVTIKGVDEVSVETEDVITTEDTIIHDLF